MLRTLFFGTSAFAVPPLDVVADRSDLLGVVTQPDRPAGRGQRRQPSPIKRAALERDVRVYQPANLGAFADELRGISIDCFVVASYGRILPASLLALPSLGALGIHPSLLPRYRGATPIQGALLAGERETGVTIMLMDAGMDTGDIVVQEPLVIAPDENYGALHDRLARLGARLVGTVLAIGDRDGTFPRAPQSGDASLTRPVRKEDLLISWEWPAAKIVNHVRAYSPQPAARAVLAGTTVKILQARVASARDDNRLLVPCGDGVVAVESLIAPNRGVESGAAFARRAGLA